MKTIREYSTAFNNAESEAARKKIFDKFCNFFVSIQDKLTIGEYAAFTRTGYEMSTNLNTRKRITK